MDDEASEAAARPTKIQVFLDNLTHEQLVDRLDLALEGASLGIWDWDLRDDSVQFDRRWCEMLGLEHTEIEMNLDTWSSRVHPDDIEGCFADIQAHLRGETTSYENVHRMRHADGSWRHILDRGRVSGRAPDGTPVRMTGTHFDVTKVEQAKQVLARQQEQLAELVRQLPTPVAMVDTEMRYVAATDAWVADYGLDADAIIGVSHYEVFASVPEHWKEIHRRALLGERLAAVEDRFEREDGRVHWLNWDVRPWHAADGGIGGILMMSEDVSEAVHNRTTRESESRLASLGLMAGGVAHEINTPMHVVGLEVEFLDDALRQPKPDLDAMRDSLATLETAANRVAEVVAAMRSLTRATKPGDERDVDVSTILADAETLSRSRFTSRGVELRVRRPAAPAAVRGQHAAIGQILMNLMNNALDACQSGQGTHVVVGFEGRDGVPSFFVEDDGPGIPAHDVSRIMEPFFTTKAVGAGTGLGLSISLALAERTCATLRLASNANPTRFELMFPPHATTPEAE